MTWEVVFGCIIIAAARIGDVSLGTIRSMSVVNGWRGLAWVFGFFEVTIWVFVVSAVVGNIANEPAFGVAFAVGAATGNFVGVTVQRWLPFGNQVVRVFTRHGQLVFDELHRGDFRVTTFDGMGRDGAVSMLFVQVRRDRSRQVVQIARMIDQDCFYTIDDIRIANAAIARPSLPTEHST